MGNKKQSRLPIISLTKIARGIDEVYVASSNRILIDIAKLDRMVRCAPNALSTAIKVNADYLFVAIDDQDRISFLDTYPDASQESATRFLREAVDHFRSFGAHPERILTDNALVFCSKAFTKACRQLRLQHSFHRPYHPQTKASVERFIRAAVRERYQGDPNNYSCGRAPDGGGRYPEVPSAGKPD